MNPLLLSATEEEEEEEEGRIHLWYKWRNEEWNVYAIIKKCTVLYRPSVATLRGRRTPTTLEDCNANQQVLVLALQKT